jgi:hypothetical protein
MRKRVHSHFQQLRKGVHSNAKLQRTYDKYGETSFGCGVLELGAPAAIRAIEAYWIRALSAVKQGFNLAYDTVAPMAGLVSRPCSPEKKAKIAAAQTGPRGFWFGKIGPRSGSSPSLETRAKISRFFKGKPWSQARRAAQDRRALFA